MYIVFFFFFYIGLRVLWHISEWPLSLPVPAYYYTYASATYLQNHIFPEFIIYLALDGSFTLSMMFFAELKCFTIDYTVPPENQIDIFDW